MPGLPRGHLPALKYLANLQPDSWRTPYILHRLEGFKVDLALGLVPGMAFEAVALQQDPHLRAVVLRELGKAGVVPGPGKGDRTDDRGQN